MNALLFRNADWRLWPMITLDNDQGSDDKSAVSALEYYPPLQLNVMALWDWGHGSSRSVLQCFRKCGKFSFVLLVMCVINLVHGPDGTDTRYEQIISSMRHQCEVSGPGSSPLFQSMLPGMVKCLRDMDEIVPEDDTQSQFVWNWMKEHSMFEKKGYKANLNRFHSFVHDGKDLLKQVMFKLYQVSYLVCELDFLSKRVWNFAMQCQLRGRDPSAPLSTASSALTLDDKILRSCGANAVVIAWLVLGREDNVRLLAFLIAIGTVVMNWYAHSSRVCRDVARSKAWLLQQVTGGYMQHIDTIFGLMLNVGVLSTCRFIGVSDDALLVMEAEDLLREEEFATEFGLLVLVMAAEREVRVLWMFLPPVVMVGTLMSSPLAQTFVDDFKVLDENFHRLKNYNSTNPKVKRVLARHVCHKVANQHLKLGYEEEGYLYTSHGVREVIERRFSCAMTTEVVENCNNIMKNARQKTGWGSKYRKPETSYHVAAQSSLMDVTYKFKRPPDVPQDHAAFPLPASAFVAKKDLTVPASTIVGSGKAPYFSPNAENTGMCYCDAPIIAAVLARNDPDLIGQAWQGFWCQAKHMLCFRIEHDGVVELDWHVALFHYAESGCLAWPVRLNSPPGYEEEPSALYVEFLQSPSMKPVALSILDFEKVTCYVIRCHSWAWHLQKYPLSRGNWPPGVRFFTEQGVVGVLEAAARNGFWDLGASVIKDIFDHKGFHLPSTATTFDRLYMMTMQILDCTGVVAVQLLAHRLAAMEKKGQFSDELLSIDEATTCLDESDWQELKTQQNEAHDAREALVVFKSEYKAQARANRHHGLTPAQTRASDSIRAKWKGPKKIPSLIDVTHDVGKKLMPPFERLPKTYLWRSNASFSWNTRVGELPSVSRCDHAHGGPKLSMLLVIRECWDTWLTLNGYDKESCPVEGMWDIIDPAPLVQ
jgi:hypothetical protein